MSSPVAHCSLIFFAWPALRRALERRGGASAFGAGSTRARRLKLAAAALFALMAPDFDLLAGPLVGKPYGDYHNGVSHSLLVGMLFAVPYALVVSRLLAAPFSIFFVFGFVAYASHVLIDAVTWGVGVQMLWPLSDARFFNIFDNRFALFRGVRHSHDVSIGVHLTNLVNDVVFAGFVWTTAWWWNRTRVRRGGSVSP